MKEYKLFVGLTIGTQRFDLKQGVSAVKQAMKENQIAGYTITQASGYWQGIEEPSLIVLIVGKRMRKQVKKAGLKIKILLAQDCVLFTEQKVTSKMLK